MRRHLRIDGEMSRRLGECGLSRNAAIRFRAQLRDDLERRYQIHRQRRHPDDPQFFVYLIAVADGTVMHRFVFLIDDSTSPDDLFVMDFAHRRSEG